MERIKKFFADESGANAVEYGIIMALISLAIIVAAGAVGTALNTTFNSAATTMTGVAS
jgi:pilus assembly protein Flp/PilA